MWEGYRTPWSLNSGGAKDGLYVRTTTAPPGSASKARHSRGPARTHRRGRFGADSNVVFALIEAKKGGLYRSDDGGEHWSLITMTTASASAPGISPMSGPIRKM